MLLKKRQCMRKKINQMNGIEPCTEENCQECGNQSIKDQAIEQLPPITKNQSKQTLLKKNEFEGLFKHPQLDSPEQERINKIIEQTARTSEYYLKEESKKKECLIRIKRFRNKIQTLSSNTIQWQKTRELVSGLLQRYEKDRYIDRTWIYIDMDMFFAAVEIRDDPSLNDKPVAVFDNKMIMTANYVARKSGVHSGMPKFIGEKLCKDIEFRKANYSKYRQISDEFKGILSQYDQKLESQGLDEVSVDVTEFLQKNNMDHMDGRIFLGEKIRKEIYDSTQLTASCGIACNKLLAKICSGIKKPNGMTYLDFDQEVISNFMRNLPIDKLMGIGKVHQRVLTGLGILTCKDMVDKATEIYVNYNESQFQFFLKSALGVDRNYHEDTIQKSIGVSQTFKPIVDKKDHEDKVKAMAIELYERLLESQLVAKTLTLELKTSKFNIKQRSTTFHQYIQEKNDIVRASEELLNVMWPINEPVRLIGIRGSTNSDEAPQDCGDSRVSLGQDEDVDQIKPEEIGLYFDRARMNSSNRRAIDHFKAKKAKELGIPPTNDETQINPKSKDLQSTNTINLSLDNSNKSIRAKRNGCDITNFLRKKHSSNPQSANKQNNNVEYELDDLLSDFNPDQKQYNYDEEYVEQKQEYKNLRLTEREDIFDYKKRHFQENNQNYCSNQAANEQGIENDTDMYQENERFENYDYNYDKDEYDQYKDDDEYDLFEKGDDEFKSTEEQIFDKYSQGYKRQKLQ
ncbi:dna polymerase iv kappa [Stylonychia lemnae]|uniref:DNA polymerase kappa n=1 Tax=Stylonychia lemnae TaxID=5949 RepID=A0A078APK8_STYLE|nr:dna polymerase iv kappa [Stylonychia lemnae]|eukprot:CDW84079.1 dna polymerase iv kappa [Stylonychia lemnae]